MYTKLLHSKLLHSKFEFQILVKLLYLSLFEQLLPSNIHQLFKQPVKFLLNQNF